MCSSWVGAYLRGGGFFEGGGVIQGLTVLHIRPVPAESKTSG